MASFDTGLAETGWDAYFPRMTNTQHTHHTNIYRVLGSDEWAQALSSGQYDGAAHDIADGFIHFSTQDTLAATLALHYAGRDHLKLLRVPVAPIADKLKWEPARGGTLFPHLYDVLSVEYVTHVDDVRLDDDGVHILPDHLR